jgi:hypothetical protein
VGEDVHAFAGRFSGGRGANQGQARGRDSAVERDVLVADFHSKLAGGVSAHAGGKWRDVRAHAIERPAKVHRGGPRREERRVRMSQPGVGRILA